MENFKIENRRYLGSKAKLLDFIHEVVDKHCGDVKTFADIFGGTGNVAWSFNNKKTKVIVNDLLQSNYYSYLAFFGNLNIDETKLKNIIESYNVIDVEDDNYFSINFDNTYFSKTNCKKIGYIREDIEKRFSNLEINDRERAYLITSLIYAMDHIANTVGHYDAYRLNGDLNKQLELKPLEVGTININKQNEIYSLDANILVKNISADVVYIDPPYNSRQYCDAYHLLENVAKWEKPEVFGVAKKMKRGKEIKSDYCTQKAPQAFEDLISNIDSKYIIVSFNNMGEKGAGRSQSKISDEEIIRSLSKKGEVTVFSTAFNQFTTGKTKIENHQERLFLCECYRYKKFIKSPLNYTGGKYKLLPQMFEFFDNTKKMFIDVFGGGFNVGVNSKVQKIIYNDKCIQVSRLIKMLAGVEYETLEKKILKIIDKYNLSKSYENGYEMYGCNSSDGLGKFNKNQFECLKNDYNTLTESDEKDLLLLVLIFYSFNNQIRFNSEGKFNLPVGKRDFNSSIQNNLKEFCDTLKKKDISFYSNDFENLLPLINNESFVYCDPPYYLGTAAYNENNGWNEIDEERLLNFLNEVNNRNVKFALSNLLIHHGVKHELLEQWALENNYNVHYIKSSYSNSNYHIKDKKSESIEVLITNY